MWSLFHSTLGVGLFQSFYLDINDYVDKFSGKIKNWVWERKHILDEKEYFNFLSAYEKWIKEA